jgi:hypothetical protein
MCSSRALTKYPYTVEESAKGKDFLARTEQLQEKLAQRVSMVHFARNAPWERIRTLLDLLNLCAFNALQMNSLIVRFTQVSEEVLMKPHAHTNVYQIDIVCLTVILLWKS